VVAELGGGRRERSGRGEKEKGNRSRRMENEVVLWKERRLKKETGEEAVLPYQGKENRASKSTQ